MMKRILSGSASPISKDADLPFPLRPANREFDTLAAEARPLTVEASLVLPVVAAARLRALDGRALRICTSSKSSSSYSSLTLVVLFLFFLPLPPVLASMVASSRLTLEALR